MDYRKLERMRLDDLRKENARLREIVTMLANFDARNSIVHLRALAVKALEKGN